MRTEVERGEKNSSEFVMGFILRQEVDCECGAGSQERIEQHGYVTL